MQNSEMYTNPNYIPITCPRCGSREIAFVTEYHKCLGLRIFITILVLLMFVFAGLTYYCALRYGISLFAQGIEDTSPLKEWSQSGVLLFGFLTIACGISSFIIMIIILVNESMTHVQAICRDCGKLWLLN